MKKRKKVFLSYPESVLAERWRENKTRVLKVRRNRRLYICLFPVLLIAIAYSCFSTSGWRTFSTLPLMVTSWLTSPEEESGSTSLIRSDWRGNFKSPEKKERERERLPRK